MAALETSHGTPPASPVAAKATLLPPLEKGFSAQQQDAILAAAGRLLGAPSDVTVGGKRWASGKVKLVAIGASKLPDIRVNKQGALEILFHPPAGGQTWEKITKEIVQDLERLSKPRPVGAAAGLFTPNFPATPTSTLSVTPAPGHRDLKVIDAVGEVYDSFLSAQELGDGPNPYFNRALKLASAVTRFIGKVAHLNELTGPRLKVGDQLCRFLGAVTTELHKGALIDGHRDPAVLNRLQEVSRALAREVELVKPASSLTEQIELQAYQDGLNLDAKIWPDALRLPGQDLGLTELRVETILD